MNRKQKFLFLITLLFIQPGFFSWGNFDDDDKIYDVDDDKQIRNRSYEYYRAMGNLKLKSYCSWTLLNSYGLSGDSKSLGEPNELCPNIKGNCCGKKDIKNIKEYWKKDSKRIGHFIRTEILIYRYILGFGKQYGEIAHQILNGYRILKNHIGKSKRYIEGRVDYSGDTFKTQNGYSVKINKFCLRAAKTVKNKLDYTNKKKIEAFYEQLTRRLEYLHNVRMNFYCMLCSANFKRNHYTDIFWPNCFYHRRIYYSDQFCSQLFTMTYPVTFKIYKGFNPFVSSVLSLMQCTGTQNNQNNNYGKKDKYDKYEQSQFNNQFFDEKSQEKERKYIFDFTEDDPLHELTEDQRQLFENPLHVKNKTLLNNCQRFRPYEWGHQFFCATTYCGHFRITKQRILFDGDLDRLMSVFERLETHEDFLMNKGYNQFNDKVVELKARIRRSFKAIRKNYYFFKPLELGKFDLSKYYSSFWLKWGRIGINPMEEGRNCKLEFAYKNGTILKFVLGLIGIILCLVI